MDEPRDECPNLGEFGYRWERTPPGIWHHALALFGTLNWPQQQYIRSGDISSF